MTFLSTASTIPSLNDILPWFLLYTIPSSLCLLVLLKYILIPQRTSMKDPQRAPLQHAVISGGSSGIGLAIAEELVQHDCHYITLLARGETQLTHAKTMLDTQIHARGSLTIVTIVSVDVTHADEMVTCIKELYERNPSMPPPSLLFNVAGTSSSGTFLNTDSKEFERLMSINYLGSVHTTKTFLPLMIDSPKQPRTIVFTSSAAGQVGIYGYTAYSPTKYALRGLAEALQMEVSKHDISVQIAYPPDTDTPGYALEQVGKPKETHLISESGGLVQPKDVAKKMVSSAIQPSPSFSVYFGSEGWMLTTLTAGMSPVYGVLDGFCQIVFMGLCRLISLCYLQYFRNIISKTNVRVRKSKVKHS